jgi:hypothetical protein
MFGLSVASGGDGSAAPSTLRRAFSGKVAVINPNRPMSERRGLPSAVRHWMMRLLRPHGITWTPPRGAVGKAGEVELDEPVNFKTLKRSAS